MSGVKAETLGRKRDDGLIAPRKEEISHSASRVSAENGYANTDMEQAASTLDINKGTICRLNVLMNGFGSEGARLELSLSMGEIADLVKPRYERSWLTSRTDEQS